MQIFTSMNFAKKFQFFPLIERSRVSPADVLALFVVSFDLRSVGLLCRSKC